MLPDFPAPAHAKAITALDGFDQLLTMYVAVLDTQRVHLSASSFDALTEALARGDEIAAQATVYGRRVAPLREAIASGHFSGPRAADLARRFDLAQASAQRASDLAEGVAAICSVVRGAADTALQAPSGRSAGMPTAYERGTSRALAIDRRG